MGEMAPLVISSPNTEFPVCQSGPVQLIHIRGNDNDTNDYIIFKVDGKSFVVQAFCDIVVEGSNITVSSNTLPVGSILKLTMELISTVPCYLEWGVKNGNSQRIYQGPDQSQREFLIYGPQADASGTPGKVKSILVSAVGQKSSIVTEVASMYVSGPYVQIDPNDFLGASSATGKYTLIK